MREFYRRHRGLHRWLLAVVALLAVYFALRPVPGLMNWLSRHVIMPWERAVASVCYLFRTSTVQDFSGVTGACLLVKTAVYDEMHGLDEQFAVAFNDVDFCLRVRDAGYRIAWTPYAELIHYESKSRGGDEKDPVKAARFAAEQQRLYTIHGKENILDDPYYNPNLTRDREDFSESDDLRRLKEGRVTVRFRGGTLQ